ncbi:phosphatidate cytidylyltransferase [Breznakiella homolactica]|uniref:Phosphatidate cytidylyltransferase n=1 Tax=Breznakiella homolactica TaxID=2798577 RepID=A0A7T7XKH2_9SPIR|nr:phosphatidate cytidylyltransferase [Breznakiella homolactica]QQO08085.1 phosphatidate cytidylyltransferase [Breznakiella homolactica]
MKKLVQRLLMFAVGLPLVVCIVVLLPQKNHLAVNIAVIILSVLGSLEFSDMLKRKKKGILLPEVIILGALGPLAATISVSFGFGGEVIPAAFIFGASWLLVSRIFLSEAKLTDVIDIVSSGFSIMIYPGLFMVWIIRMGRLPNATMILLMFLLTVIANDSLAWAVGMLFGRGNRGIIAASPNKSIAGFAGGFAGSILIGIGGTIFVPSAFTATAIPSVAAGIILGLFTGAAGSLGDLAESALKRSSNIKDSGSIIPGRGGVLDTIDSISLAAPVFYSLYWLLFL